MQIPHTIIVTLEAKAGKEQALKAALTELLEPTRREPGCVNYVLHCSPSDPAKFMFYETWTDKAAHGEHGKTAHMNAWRAKKEDLLAKQTEVSVWEIV